MHWNLRGWTLAGLLLAVMFALVPVGTAQVTTTQIADTIYRADGSAATGTVVISWPQFSTATGQAVSGGSISATIAAGGVLNVGLAPNAGSNPMGSYYTVVYHLNDGSISREYWVVPASASPVKVSAIRSTVLPLSVAQNTVSKSYVDQAIAQAVSGGVALDNSTPYVAKAGDTMTGPLVLPADPVGANEAADKHYVDSSVQQVASGIGQKVALLPQGSQQVVQPTGSQLHVNLLNGVEYASQYATGNGNNGIANAIASPDCANGCDLTIEDSYNSAEPYNPSALRSGTHLDDKRLGTDRDIYVNPGNLTLPGNAFARSLDLMATVNPAIVGGNVVSGTPTDLAFNLSIEGLAGGSNLFPASIEPSVPYFKSNYVAQTITGTYNTAGQHSLLGETINCYGVGDCLFGARFMKSSGGFRDEADEGAHPFDLNYSEDPAVFTGSCSGGCSPGATTITVSPNGGGGTQGEGRFLIDKNPAHVLSSGLLTGGISGAPYPSGVFSGTSFPQSVFFATAQAALSQANNIAPGTVTLPIATSGVTAGFATNTAAAPATSGVACVADQNPAGAGLPHNYEMANYTVVDGTHFRLTLNKVHAAQSTVAIGGLCGYGLEQVVDTTAGLRQIFPVVGSYSPTALYYAGGLTAVVGIADQTSGFLNVSVPIASIARSQNVVTLTATGNFPQDINGLTMTVSGVGDSSYNGSFSVTTTGPNTLTYTQNGPDSSSGSGAISLLTGGYALYPMAEVLGVFNQATKQVDGQMTLAPNTVAWTAGDAVEQPHYYQQRVSADVEVVSQTLPRATSEQQAGITYAGKNAQGLVGFQIANADAYSDYLGAGGTHLPPSVAFIETGLWQQAMQLEAGQEGVFNIRCNFHGCGRWNSTYDLFDLQSNTGADTIRYQPQTSTLDINMKGVDFIFSPQSFTTSMINVGQLNAGSINGHVSGNSITSGAVAAAYLPLLGGSGTSHAAGIVPDPGAVSGATRFLREDGTWSIPGGSGAGGGNLVPGATADYNFLQGAGTVLLDSTGNNNNGSLVASAAPTWTTTGLAFAPGQAVSLPAALNGTQTFVAGIYINPLTAGSQVQNVYPVLVSNSTGGGGFNFMYSYIPSTHGGFIPGAYAPTFFVNGQVATAAPNLVSGFHVLAAVLGGSGSTDHVYVDGVEVASYVAQGASAGAQTTGNFFIGSSGVNPWLGSGISGTMYRLRLYPTQLGATAVQAVTSAIVNEVASRGVATTPVNIQLAAPQFQAVGDSITFGQGVSTAWPSLLTLINQPAYTVTNWGITGITLAAINGSELNRAALRCRATVGPSIAVVMAGTNDFAVMGGSATPVFANLMGEVQTLKQAGCKVFVGTMISRTGSAPDGQTMDSDKNTYNALILSQAKAGGADGVIDFAANPLVGADGASAGAYFQSDHVHPTQAGQAILAAEASNVLNYTFGYNEGNPHVVTSLNYSMTATDGYVSLAGLTGAGTITLPDCTGQSGVSYRINNSQAAFAVSVVPLNAAQAINGLGSVSAPANGTLTLRDVPNPKTVAGCHWEM